ncbi:MAG TPA: hypothetical protein DEF82_02740 [Crocinitomicaceae bacterium]|nr:hypothetical protein [Flavobacteriales bacterium]HBW85678.1 hypothetical protein [Crocinitomicaceae bacterium]
MTESEALALIGCKSIYELDDKLELLIFSIKQKILTKSFHPKVFKKYFDEIVRYKEAISRIKKDFGYREVQVAFNALSDKNPATLIENFLEQKQRSLLAIANSNDIFTLESNFNLYLKLHQNWITCWSKFLDFKVATYQSQRSNMDDMEWVRLKQLIQTNELNSWESLITKNKKPLEIGDLLDKISAYFHYLTK